MSRRYKACPIFWDGRPQRRYLANLETLRRRLDEAGGLRAWTAPNRYQVWHQRHHTHVHS